jgi:hypothetical protein
MELLSVVLVAANFSSVTGANADSIACSIPPGTSNAKGNVPINVRLFIPRILPEQFPPHESNSSKNHVQVAVSQTGDWEKSGLGPR